MVRQVVQVGRACSSRCSASGPLRCCVAVPATVDWEGEVEGPEPDELSEAPLLSPKTLRIASISAALPEWLPWLQSVHAHASRLAGMDVRLNFATGPFHLFSSPCSASSPLRTAAEEDTDALISSLSSLQDRQLFFSCVSLALTSDRFDRRSSFDPDRRKLRGRGPKRCRSNGSLFSPLPNPLLLPSSGSAASTRPPASAPPPSPPSPPCLMALQTSSSLALLTVGLLFIAPRPPGPSHPYQLSSAKQSMQHFDTSPQQSILKPIALRLYQHVEVLLPLPMPFHPAGSRTVCLLRALSHSTRA